jgi:hypothetical protein
MTTVMTPALGPRSDVIASVLLDHHASLRRRMLVERHRDPASSLLTTDRLCARAGMPGFASSVAVSLVEIARWCADHHWPPLNSLAVQKETGKPGSYYRLAPGCSVIGWSDEVRACLRFDRYPLAIGTRQCAPASDGTGAIPERVMRRFAAWLGPR